METCHQSPMSLSALHVVSLVLIRRHLSASHHGHGSHHHRHHHSSPPLRPHGHGCILWAWAPPRRTNGKQGVQLLRNCSLPFFGRCYVDIIAGGERES
ncbi:hypothetical protein B0T18DRAFT_121425 [Schizothecium vesticola]|uniref:Uncharacterized protein n=1 Tax=Schizothecium vesticola TaxID=314040 RepID=A0AA40F2J9_9PEZI|nr:hypothetical protein B0T18DRAFT_121425 [Schizothecium vesticola]